MLQFYGNLGVTLNGDQLMEQAGVTIEDHVGKPCRVTVEMVLPQKGPEIDARARLGERVRLGVNIVEGRKVHAPLLEIEGPIVASEIKQEPGKMVRILFTVEDREA